MKENILFQNLDNSQQLDVVDEMWCQKVEEGVTLIEQNSLGEIFYVVEEGVFDIYVCKSNKDKPGKKVAKRGPGSSFGELALMYNAPRAATVIGTFLFSICWFVFGCFSRVGPFLLPLVFVFRLPSFVPPRLFLLSFSAHSWFSFCSLSSCSLFCLSVLQRALPVAYGAFLVTLIVVF